MPNQLYIDSQTCVKNAYFCVAKQLELDRTQDFNLFLLGDDRLESFFGRIRMQGGHNPNCTFKQLVDRAGAAVDINNVFVRNPSLDSGHRHLKTNRTEHFDHLNKEIWKGSQSVKDVVLDIVWLSGRDAAQEALLSSGCNEDLQKVFKSDMIDMMRPFGDGRYPGVSDQSNKDRSCLLDDSVTIFEGRDIQSNTNPTELNNAEEEIDEADHCETDENVYSFCEEELSKFSAIPKPDSTAVEEIHDDLELEDLLEEPPGSLLPRPAHIQTEITPWLPQPESGKPIHKATVCRLIINPDWVRKSHERVLQVRGILLSRNHTT